MAKKKLTKKQKKIRRNLFLTILLSLTMFLFGYIAGNNNFDFKNIYNEIIEIFEEISGQRKKIKWSSSEFSPNQEEKLNQIHILDVGQGAATLLIDENGTSILVDTGRHDDSEKKIISYLDQYIGLGEKIDLLIFTHNHSDHIGHGDLVMDYFDVQEVWMNGMDHTTKVYEKVLDAILDSEAEYKEPKAGETFDIGDFKINVLQPKENSPQKDHNDESIITHISFAGYSLMTSGDASIPREKEIIQNNNHDLQANFLIVGHHGANNSTSDEWLEAVSPEMAFYQAGIDNIYGHPHEETIMKLQQAGVPVYGTDEFGTISIYINEDSEIKLETEK